MGEWRKKPLVVEAIQFAGITDEGLLTFGADEHPPKWLARACAKGVVFAAKGLLYVRPLVRAGGGQQLIERGDWIVRGIKGELYTVTHDIFARTYDPAHYPAY